MAACACVGARCACKVKTRRRALCRWPDIGRHEIEAALRGAVEEVDAALLAAGRAPGLDGAPPDPDKTLPDGTTAAWALLWGRELLVAWLGDSRAVLCRWTNPPVDKSEAPCEHDAPAGCDMSAVAWDGAGRSQQGTAMAAESESGHSRTDRNARAAPCMWGAARGWRLAAVALTEDHSPARPDERARILAAGGTVSPVFDGALQHVRHRRCAQRDMWQNTCCSKGTCLALQSITSPFVSCASAHCIALLGLLQCCSCESLFSSIEIS